MASAILTKVAYLVVFCMVVEALVAPHVGEATIANCTPVMKDLGQCMAYLKEPGEPTTPPSNCCTGVRALKAAAQSTPDRRMACNCMKKAAAGTSSLNYKSAGSLASGCGVSIGYGFNPKIDCNTVK